MLTRAVQTEIRAIRRHKEYIIHRYFVLKSLHTNKTSYKSSSSLQKAAELSFIHGAASGYGTKEKSIALICHPSEMGNLGLWFRNQHILQQVSSKFVFFFFWKEVNPYHYIKKNISKSQSCKTPQNDNNLSLHTFIPENRKKRMGGGEGENNVGAALMIFKIHKRTCKFLWAFIPCRGEKLQNSLNKSPNEEQPVRLCSRQSSTAAPWRITEKNPVTTAPTGDAKPTGFIPGAVTSRQPTQLKSHFRPPHKWVVIPCSSYKQ